MNEFLIKLSDELREYLDERRQAEMEAIARRQRTCLECLFFDEDKDLCQRFHARPPAHVIVYGCDAFEQDIPF